RLVVRTHPQPGAGIGVGIRSTHRTHLPGTRSGTGKSHVSSEPEDQHGEDFVPRLATLPKNTLWRTSSVWQEIKSRLCTCVAAFGSGSLPRHLVQPPDRSGFRQGRRLPSKRNPRHAVATPCHKAAGAYPRTTPRKQPERSRREGRQFTDHASHWAKGNTAFASRLCGARVSQPCTRRIFRITSDEEYSGGERINLRHPLFDSRHEARQLSAHWHRRQSREHRCGSCRSSQGT